MDAVKRHAPLAGLVLLIAGYFAFRIFPHRPAVHLPVLIGGGLVLALGVFWNRTAIVMALRGRAVRSGGAAVLYTLVVLAIWVFANYLGREHHKRFDFTEEKVFTLHERTIEELKRIDRPIELIAFIGEAEDVTRGRIEDLINEYRYHTDRISYRFVDPFKNLGEVERFDITEEGTLVLISGTNQEKVVGFDEEKVTNAINQVRQDRSRVIYFTAGHGERSIDDFEGRGVSQLRDGLRDLQYEVRAIQLFQEEAIPADATVVVVAGPESEMLGPEADMVRNWVDAGGSLLVLAEPQQPHGLDAILGGFGIRVNDDRVINVNPVSRFLGFDANVPIATDYVAHPITEAVGVLTFYPVSASVELIEDGAESDVVKQYLVQTDADTWGERNLEELQSGQVARNEEEDRLGPIPIAAVATRPVDDTPEGSVGEGTESEPAAANQEPGSGRRSRLVVFGDSSFASNQYFNLQGNAPLLLNVAEWLAEGEDSISIPPRRPKSRTLTLNQLQARTVFYSTVFALPGTLLILGVVVWARRRNL
jgi:ABC-type uncharacterized transport system involved in gliding motility auxiliary subunit